MTAFDRDGVSDDENRGHGPGTVDTQVPAWPR